MKKFYFLAVALVSCLYAQAQQQIVSLGFEDGDATHTTEWALTPGAKYGDFVNVQEDDYWVEQSEEAAHSGQYGLYVLNGNSLEGQQWQRGFKVGHLPVKENTSYRVSFWIKAENRFKSSISIGREYFDNELQSPVNKTSYNYNWNEPTGEWQRVSYVTFNTTKAFLDGICRERYGEGDVFIGEDNTSVPEEWRGQKIGNGAEGFPEDSYFVIINMYNPGEYMLDDILVEEGVAVNGCSYSEVALKIDFGYPTNIAALANANGGSYSLPTSYVTIAQGAETFPVEYLEAMPDGYLYAFFPDGVYPDYDNEDPVVVTFTPDADCPVIYSTDKRPSADTESQMAVLGFQDEVAYYDESIDVLSPAWRTPHLVGTTPENESFELENDFGKVVFTFDCEVSLDDAKASLEQNGMSQDWTKKMSLSEDGKSVIFTFDRLDDGEYTLRLSGVANQMGEECEQDQVMVFSVGVDSDDTESEEIYCPDWSTLANGTFPKGWVSNDNGTIHEYGVTDNGQVWDYNWGGNLGGGGCRAMTGYSGDFNGGAMYWRCMNAPNQYGELTYGAQVEDYIMNDGTVDPDMDPEIGLYLEPGKYQISFKMAAWKFMGEPATIAPRYDFELTDLNGDVYAQFTDFEGKPNVNGAQNIKVEGATNNVADFTVSEAGYYILRFSTTQANAELLMGNLRLITMPSKASYYRHMLAEACDEAEDVLFDAYDDLELYGGPDMEALDAEINKARSASFHAPSEIYAEIEVLKQLAAVLTKRIENIQTYVNSIDDATDAIAQMEGTKYMNVDVVSEVADILAKYGDTNPADMTCEELAAVAPVLGATTQKLANVVNCTNILTWGVSRAISTYNLLDGTDETLVEQADNAVSDDRELANTINQATTLALYKQIVAGTWNEEENLSKVIAFEMANIDDETQVAVVEGDSIVGIDMSGFVANPKLYRVYGNSGVPGWNLSSGAEGKNQNISWGGAELTDANYVSDMLINIYGDATYDLNQTITNLPVGKYIVEMSTRTPLVDKMGDYEKIFYYNAQDSLGTWDKYIYANTTVENKVAPYLGGSWGYGSDANNTVIREVTIGKDEELTIGFCENYVSGLAMRHEDNTPQGAWTGTSFADDVHIYFVAPLEGFDYAAEVHEIETALDTILPNATVTEVYTLGGVRLNKVQKGINIVKMSNGKVMKVVVK